MNAKRIYADPHTRHIKKIFILYFIGSCDLGFLQIRLQHNDALHFYSDMPWHDRALFRQVIAAHGFSDVELLYKVWTQLEDDRKVQVSTALKKY